MQTSPSYERRRYAAPPCKKLSLRPSQLQISNLFLDLAINAYTLQLQTQTHVHALGNTSLLSLLTFSLCVTARWALGNLRMKFGKRLAGEASRRWRPFYIDYKALKQAIQRDIDGRGTTKAPPESVFGIQHLALLALFSLMNSNLPSKSLPCGRSFREIL